VSTQVVAAESLPGTVTAVDLAECRGGGPTSRGALRGEHRGGSGSGKSWGNSLRPPSGECISQILWNVSRYGIDIKEELGEISKIYGS